MADLISLISLVAFYINGIIITGRRSSFHSVSRALTFNFSDLEIHLFKRGFFCNSQTHEQVGRQNQTGGSLIQTRRRRAISYAHGNIQPRTDVFLAHFSPSGAILPFAVVMLLCNWLSCLRAMRSEERLAVGTSPHPLIHILLLPVEYGFYQFSSFAE